MSADDSILQHMSAYVSIRQHTSAYAVAQMSRREHTISNVDKAGVLGELLSKGGNIVLTFVLCRKAEASNAQNLYTLAFVSIRQHASAFVRIREHTSYVRIREHT